MCIPDNKQMRTQKENTKIYIENEERDIERGERRGEQGEEKLSYFKQSKLLLAALVHVLSFHAHPFSRAYLLLKINFKI